MNSVDGYYFNDPRQFITKDADIRMFNGLNV